MTGIINGSGSVTAAFGQLAIPVLAAMGQRDNVGYRYVWYFLILCTAAGTSLMSGRIMKELYPTASAQETRPLNDSHPTRGNYSAVSTQEDSKA